MIKEISLIGPPCVGKGFLLRLLREYYEKLGRFVNVIGMGDLVRNRMSNDLAFKDQYFIPMIEGELIPDHEVTPMFRKALLDRKPNSHVAQEGYLRTPQQIKDAEEMGLLDCESVSVLLLASDATCHDRAIDRAERKPNGPRLDEAKFNDRLTQDRNIFPAIHSGLRRTRTKVIQLDANRDLLTGVFPDLQAIAQAHWDERLEPQKPVIPQRLIRIPINTSQIASAVISQNESPSGMRLSAR